MTSPTIACPESQSLLQWLRGDLEKETSNDIGQHIASCEQCQNRLLDLTDIPGFPRVRPPSANQDLPFASEPEFKKLQQQLRMQRPGVAEESNNSNIQSTNQAAVEILTRANLKTSEPQHDKQQEDVGLEIEGFRFERALGRGGFGQVFLAWDLSLDRPVAIKVLKSAELDARNRMRFYREARSVAKLIHPGIIRVYRVDETDDGQPFIVMEYVEGGTLAEETEAHVQTVGLNRRNIDSAVQYICEIADGLSVVHSNGLIHRDIKPANILLDKSEATTSAKLADFGLVKHVRNESVTLTRAAELVGTPAFMTPEQTIENGHIDERSDIYSLGATLYYAITGQPPFRGTSVAILRQIVETEPSSPRVFNEIVPLALETICLKCLAKEPSRRYQTADELGDDLRAYLDDRPIKAKPVSSVERFWMWCRRNRALAATLLMLFASLLTGTMVSTAMWIRAAASDKQSRNRLVQVENGNEIIGSIFDDLNMLEIKQDNKSLEAVLAERLVEAGKRINTKAIGDPLTEAKLRNQLGNSLVSLGYPNEAIPILKKAMDIRSSKLNGLHLDNLKSMHDLGWAYNFSGEYQLALPLFKNAYESRSTVLGPTHADTLESMAMYGHTHNMLGNLDQARTLLLQTLELRKESLGVDHEDTAFSMTQMGEFYLKEGKVDQARPLYEQAYETRLKVFGEDHYVTIVAINNLAFLAVNANRFEDAIARFEQSLDRLQRKLGDEHESTINNMGNLAYCYAYVNRLDDAIELYEKLVDIQTKKHGEKHRTTLIVLNNLARCYELNGQIEEAISLFQKVLSTSLAEQGEDHPDTITRMNNLASAFATAGRHSDSVSLYVKALDLKRTKFGNDHVETLKGAANLGRTYAELDQLDDAIPLLEEACAKVDDFLALRGTVGILMDAYIEAERIEDAKRIFNDNKHVLSDTGESDNMVLANDIIAVSLPLLKLKMFEDAEPLLRTALGIYRRLDSGDWTAYRAMSMLGEALLGQGKIDESGQLLRESIDQLQKQSAEISVRDRHLVLNNAIGRMIGLAEKRGNSESVKHWQEQRELLSQQE